MKNEDDKKTDPSELRIELLGLARKHLPDQDVRVAHNLSMLQLRALFQERWEKFPRRMRTKSGIISFRVKKESKK